MFWAHVRANMYVLWDAIKGTLTYNPGRINPPLLVYTRWSLEDEGWGGIRRARQIGVGYWTRPLPGQQSTWVDHRIYFLEEYSLETLTWKRAKNP